MQKVKFSFNAFIMMLIIFSIFVIFVFFGLTDMANIRINNDVYEIEGTDYSVRYTELTPSGLYKGKGYAGELKVEGNFGYDWGVSIEDGVLYCNEYRMTSLGMMVSDFVRIDLETYEKKVVIKNAMMIGKCESGEIVCLDGFMMPSWQFETNSLYKLYSMSSDTIRAEDDVVTVRYFDGGKTVYSFEDSMTDEDRIEYYRSLDLKEVNG